MTHDADLDAYFTKLAVSGGTPPLSPEETEAVLDLTKVVAHTSERYYAPLAAYAAGLAIGADGGVGSPSARAARVRELIDVVRTMRKESGA